MSTIQDRIKQRFYELEQQGDAISLQQSQNGSFLYVDNREFFAWASSVWHLLKNVFGTDSPHYEAFSAEVASIGKGDVWEEFLINA